MGSINSIPVISQLKSLVQVIGGDAAGAKKTQEEFVPELALLPLRSILIFRQFEAMMVRQGQYRMIFYQMPSQ